MLSVDPMDSFLYFWITCVCAHILLHVIELYFFSLLFRHSLPDSCQAVAGAMDSLPESTLSNISINVPLITNNTVEVSTTPFLLDMNSHTRILSQAQFTSEDVEATQRVEQISMSLHAKDPMDPEAITTAMMLKQMVSMHLENTKQYEHDRLQKDWEN